MNRALPEHRGCGNVNCKSCQSLSGAGPWRMRCGKDMSPVDYDFVAIGEPWTEPCDQCEKEMAER